ncbi:hypothetical protein BCR43DRAFT_499102 [Syncephalastrum racemosum]|uniref:S-adenosyl-L-methionine-dependent methyltransferase n=1 Tax=Syncephalastrum racemosum TaxID=13706 RepID=A0A1X2H1X4_SYNRA|nr:hypothetical protein BCR43DRAFT_499102 [Syncephalastrum racemosum]
MDPLKMLEFYSGIGGMHYAADLAGWDVQVCKAFDINNVCNDVYKYNFDPNIVGQRQIEALDIAFYDKLAVDVWTMSPPCQPYTRTGLQQGSQDPRSRSFLHVLRVLTHMEHRPKYILVENVKGFEQSDSRDVLVDTLEKCNYTFQEFLLTPLQLGIPNSRLRYYLLAKQKPLTFCQAPTGTILSFIPFSNIKSGFVDGRTLPSEEQLVANIEVRPVSDYLEDKDDLSAYLVPDKILSRHGHAFDIVKPSTRRSCCFTKGYYHYVEATGSILQMDAEADTNAVFKEAAAAKAAGNDERQIELLRGLRLRYFSPREVANLMGFPETFRFPQATTLKQRYRTLGNSINVQIVGELMKFLMKS